MARAFRIHAADNVVTLLQDGQPGPIDILGGGVSSLMLLDGIELGHKAALQAIAAGEPVVKFGVPIGTAIRDIKAGEWVHLHNCKSRCDERSGGFDLATGAAQDMRYD